MKPSTLITQLIYDLEHSLLKPEIRQSANELKQLIANDFIEFGSSGCIYNKRDLLEFLPQEKPPQYFITDFDVRELSSTLMLATYKVTINCKGSLRSSIWQYGDSGWQMIFHQGTPIIK